MCIHDISPYLDLDEVQTYTMMYTINSTIAEMSRNVSVAVIGLNDMVSSSMKREQLMPFPLGLELLDT